MAGMKAAWVVLLLVTLGQPAQPDTGSALDEQTSPIRLAPSAATPPDVVDRMLSLAKVGPGDVVYDLGCGDGRIVIAAAQQFGARDVTDDIDEKPIAQAQAAARESRVADRVKVLVQDAMTVDESPATVVTLYLLSASNAKLRPILTSQLRPGARIVSHNYPVGDWE